MTFLIVIVCYIIVRVFYSVGLFKEEIKCGAEHTVIKKEKEYFEANGYRYDNAVGRSEDVAFEGKYSVKLTPENQFGFSITLGTPKVGAQYEISVWVKQNGDSADKNHWPCLVASIGNVFWKGTIDITETKNGWGKLQMKIIIPEGDYKKLPLVIYCWNNTQSDAYFDNMTIQLNNYWKFFKN